MMKKYVQAILTRWKPLAVPGALLRMHFILLAHQVVQVFLGMPDWSALLTQFRNTFVCSKDFMGAGAALRKKQGGDKPRNNWHLPPSC